jgi:hypothetical protein
MSEKEGGGAVPGCAYITMLGRSVWALVNSYYAVLDGRKCSPTLIYVFAEERYKEELEKALKAIEILSSEYGFKPDIKSDFIKEGDFLEAGRKISSQAKRLKVKGFEIALDITPGRKALVAGSLISLSKTSVDHIFYLKISTLEGASKPYFMVPMQTQHLQDFIEDAKRGVVRQ